jgi:hypothetical protein
MENKQLISVHLRLSAAYLPFSAACQNTTIKMAADRNQLRSGRGGIGM